MSSKKKPQPVVCSNCKRELPEYKVIADAIRYEVDKNTGKYAGKTLKRAAELNPLKTVRSLGKLALNVAAEIHLISSSSRVVLNAAKYPCPYCGVFHEWKRRKKS